MIPDFRDRILRVDGQEIACSEGGSGPAVLLLHGLPRTRALRACLAPTPAERFTVVASDLRGHGGSSKPRGAGHSGFRAMGRDQCALMSAPGHDRFHLVGHDRGARTAHRMALDAGARLLSLTLMDIVPTHHLPSHLDPKVAAACRHGFFLAQAAPLPERMILADADAFFEGCLLGRGGAQLSDFAPDQLSACRAAGRDPATAGPKCDDYRATILHDFDLDAADLDRRVACPALVLDGREGAMAPTCDVPAASAPRLADMRAGTLRGGHFFIDTAPEATAAALLDVLP